MTAPGNRAVIPLLSVLFVPLWASGFIGGKLATQRMDVMTTLLWRFIIGMAVMGIVVLLTRARLPRGRQWLHLAVVALLLQVGQFSAVYTGLSLGAPAGLSSLVMGMAPLLVGLLGPLLFPERFSVLKVIGLVLGAIGVYVVLSGDLSVGASIRPLGFTVMGMACLTAGTLYQKRFGGDVDVRTAVMVQLGVSTVVTLVAVAVLHAQWLPPSLGAWAAAGWLGIFNSAGAFALMFLLLRWVSTTHVSSLLNLVPATTAIASVPILAEPLGLQAIIGLGIALVGMYVGINFGDRRSRASDLDREQAPTKKAPAAADSPAAAGRTSGPSRPTCLQARRRTD